MRIEDAKECWKAYLRKQIEKEFDKIDIRLEQAIGDGQIELRLRGYSHREFSLIAIEYRSRGFKVSEKRDEFRIWGWAE